MMPPQPPTSQDRPVDYPLVHDTSSLLGMFGMALALPIVLWALAEPVRVVGIAAVIGAVIVLARVARRVHRANKAFHVPGTGFDIEITVSRSARQ